VSLPPPHELIAIVLVVFFGIGLHEYAHAKFADLAGDPTPSYFGRVTLNLTKHFELMGTIMIIITSIAGVGIGWGKPVPMDPSKMRNPKWDHFIAVAAGPASNFVQAAIYALFIRAGLVASPEFAQTVADLSSPFVVDLHGFGMTFLVTLLFTGVLINVALCLFNLLPIGPLDGMWLLGTFLPAQTRLRWTRFNLTVGGMLFIGIILFGQLSGFSIIGQVIAPPLRAILRFLIGT
jgi:Zn-dependent protease